MNIFKMVLVIIFPFFLMGCAAILPVPGGGETINKDFYESGAEMKQLVSEVKKGASKEDVFEHLKRSEDHFILLTREQIMSNLYGGQNLEFVQNKKTPLKERNFLQDLKGYQLVFRKVKRKHGVHTPVSMRTNEYGYGYTATFIFKNDVLYEDPVLSGGLIDATSTKTVFDSLSPSLALRQMGI